MSRVVAPKRERGVVLISVLLVFAILAAIATRMAENHSLTVAQALNGAGADQALSYAIGAEELARQVLFEDFTTSGPGVDHFGESWAQALPPFDVDEGGFIEIQLRDLNGCFNLNALANADPGNELDRLKALMRSLNVPENIADGWRDWVDADELVNGLGAEDSEYLLAVPPHRSPNTQAGHESEMLMLEALEPDHWLALAPHICVLPTDQQRINVNTASAEVLAALESSTNPDALVPFVEAERQYAEVNEFVTDVPAFSAAAESLSVTSEYFRMSVRAEVGDGVSVVSSLFHRNTTDGTVTLLYRDFGREFVSRVVVETEEA